MIVDRNVLFWMGCVPSRWMLAKYADGNPKTRLRLLAWLPAVGWTLGFVNTKVGFAGGKAWWAPVRWIHGIFWGLYARTGDAMWLYVDTLFGVVDKLKYSTRNSYK